MATTEQIAVMSEAQPDALPEGIIELDRSGTILYYNAAQATLAHRARATTVGLNFFRDVAPCTAVQEFQGRFNDFVAKAQDSYEPFKFLFRFGWGQTRATITLIRRPKGAGDAIFIPCKIDVLSSRAEIGPNRTRRLVAVKHVLPA